MTNGEKPAGPRVMGLRVIGAGMGRTGTASLKRALEQLGFGPCHHMAEVIGHPAEVPTWQRAARGEKIDWKTFMKGWGACVDFPSALYYRELMEAFPDAKVILSVRDRESWYQSMQETIVPILTRFPNSVVGPYLPRIGAPARVMGETQIKKDLLDRFSDREHVLRAFDAWNEAVKQHVPPERLLVFEAKQGWAPLCALLDVPVPDLPYPRVNDTAEFKKRVLGATVVSWIVLLTPVFLVLAILAALLR